MRLAIELCLIKCYRQADNTQAQELDIKNILTRHTSTLIFYSMETSDHSKNGA